MNFFLDNLHLDVLDAHQFSLIDKPVKWMENADASSVWIYSIQETSKALLNNIISTTQFLH